MLEIIIQSLIKRKKYFIFIVIQFVVGFFALLIGLTFVGRLLEYYMDLARLAPSDSIHLYVETDSLVEQDSSVLEEYERLINKLKKEKLVDKYGMFEEKNICGKEDMVSEKEEKLYMVNNDLLKLVHFKLKKGTMQELYQYSPKEQTVPILVSEKLGRKYPIGTKKEFYYYTDSGTNKIYIEVKGILSDSMRFFNNGASNIVDGLNEEKEYIVAPEFTSFQSTIPYQCNTVFTIPMNQKRETALQEIKEIFIKTKIDLTVTTLKEEQHTYIEREKGVVISTIAFASIVLLLSILGCIGTILSSLVHRKEEFGIYYSLGFSKKSLIYMVIGEIVALFIISFMAATILAVVLVKVTIGSDGYSVYWYVIVIGFIIMLLCNLLCTILPLKQLMKLQPIDLINGRNK